MQILHQTTIRCQYIVPLLTPQWKQSLRSASTQVGDTWSLKCSIAQLDSQSRKFPPILVITEAKNPYFFVWKRTGFVHQELRDFVKMTLTRVSSHWLWLESSQSVKNVTRVELPFFSTWLESSPSHQKSWLESSHWLESRYHWFPSTWFLKTSIRHVIIGPGYDVKLHPMGKVPAREIRSFQESGTSLNPFNFG